MPKHEIYDTMERGYSDTITTSTAAPTTHSRSAIKEREQHQRTQSEPLGYQGHDRKGHNRDSLTLESVGRAVAVRGMRAVRRGNLPFLIVFVTALFVFFGALAGIGYVDPEASAAAPESEFVMGQPVFDPAEGQRLREVAMAEQKKLEDMWKKQKRPNAGAWMKKQRNDGAVRVGGVGGAVVLADTTPDVAGDVNDDPKAPSGDDPVTEETNDEKPHDHDDH